VTNLCNQIGEHAMSKNILSHRPLITLVTVLALSANYLAPAYAQTVPATSPAPSASPAAPVTFNSPFNGARDVNGVEGKDFTALMTAYDTMQDAAAALQCAINCGGNVTAAMAALNTAAAAFNTAMAQYAYDWSSFAYGGIGVPLGGTAPGNTFSQARVEMDSRYKKTDKPAILAELAAQDKKAHPVPPCSQSATTPVVPAPAPSPKPDGLKTALELGAILGIGLLAFGHGHSDRSDFDRDRGVKSVPRTSVADDR
jgi:hypothetical protein